jgi:hypothetical protein
VEVNGYWRGGQWVPGAKVRTGGTKGTSELALEVAAACSRCKEGKSEPLKEMKRLLSTYPVLKQEAREPEEHQLTPLARLYGEWVVR